MLTFEEFIELWNNAGEDIKALVRQFLEEPGQPHEYLEQLPCTSDIVA